MPTNPNKCDKEVLAHIPNHTKCHHTSHPDKIQIGPFFNQYISSSNPFKGNKKYQCCKNLIRSMDSKPIPPKAKVTQETASAVTAAPTGACYDPPHPQTTTHTTTTATHAVRALM